MRQRRRHVSEFVMFRALTPLVALLCWGMWTQPARASGDFECSPSWKLKHTVYSECDSTVLLTPGNDTRVNLLLLLRDRRADKGAANAPAGDDATPFSWRDFEGVIYGKPANSQSDGSGDAAAGLTEFAAGEGSRCLSNAGGAADFDKTLGEAARLPPDERAALSKARQSLSPSCDAAAHSAAVVADAVKAVKSAAGKPFGDYLAGAAAFYDGDYDGARQSFTRLRGAGAPWLKETARYMLGRVDVNQAQVGAFGDYGELVADKVDAKALAAADSELHAYIHDYPQGRYTASARGLLRRVYWLGGARDKLMAEYAWQFAQPDARSRNLTDGDLSQEVDAKFLDKADPDGVTDPTLLAVIDMMKMRRPDAKDSGAKDASGAIALAALRAQAPRFSADQALFGYLLAAHAYFVDDDPTQVLRLIPAETPNAPLTNLRFSRMVLRALALDAANDPGARGAMLQPYPWAKKPYQRSTLDLALAMHDERHGALGQVFALDSPVRDIQVREILLRHGAGPALLRQRAADPKAERHERRLALFTLLYKDLTRGGYRAFVADLALMPTDVPVKSDGFNLLGPEPALNIFSWNGGGAGYSCPALRDIAAQLTRDPRAAKPLLCVGEFARLNGLDHFELDTSPPADELGGAPSQFQGAAFARQEIYKGVIADPAAAADDKAYALYRAVRCYAPSGNNDCGGRDVPVGQRKAWFTTLKTRYATSPWAAELKHYW